MARHCRRRTRSPMEIRRRIELLLTSLWDATDIVGLGLFNKARMPQLWKQQQKHLECIQDPDDVPLYVQTGTVMKGGVELPVYRCGRGSVSLEFFHLHQNRFIPGLLYFILFNLGANSIFSTLLTFYIRTQGKHCLGLYTNGYFNNILKMLINIWGPN